MSTPPIPSESEAPAPKPPADEGKPPSASHRSVAALTIGAIGVVYGDIGTSPLYTVKEVFAPATGLTLESVHLIGAISTIFWALMVIVTLKYVILILRANNRGEGGTLALAALAAHAVRERPALRNGLLLLGMCGAALFYGDSLITPAISVLGAMEGLELIAPGLKDWVVPASLAILIALFMVQRFGTGRVGAWFAPIIIIWFVTLGIAGIVQIVQEPAILAALNPLHAWNFLIGRGALVFISVGAIVLAITGAEALYADMGHFGKRPIQIAWNTLVFPCLALNYLGQGALLMRDPQALENPFYRLFPDAWIVPVLILATLAAIIASQAVISGAYSLTRQAVQLGFLPRMSVRHTSAREAGQIYMPAVNWALLAGVLAAVLFFGSSSGLAGAYGIAVTLSMMTDTLLTYFVVRAGWRLPAPVAIGATLFFLAIDVLLVASCALKFFDGGWFPLALGAVLFTLMSTWWRGRATLMNKLGGSGLQLQTFIDHLDPSSMPRAARTAIYMVANPATVPQALLHNLKHNQVLHERNVIATVAFHDRPWVPLKERVTVVALGHGFWRVTLNFGFKDTPDVPKALALADAQGLHIPPFETSYFLSRESVVAPAGTLWTTWRARLYATMSRNAQGVVEFFNLPNNAVVELGTRVLL